MNKNLVNEINAAFKKVRVVNYDLSDLAARLSIPDKNANKYSRGCCNVIAGDERYPGAAELACLATERIGAGYTKLYTHASNVKDLAVALASEPATSFFNINKKNISHSGKHAFVVGPGFTPYHVMEIELVKKVFKFADCRVVVDGGALSALSFRSVRKIIQRRAKQGLQTVITPHMGEAFHIAKALNIVKCRKQMKNVSIVKLCFIMSYLLNCCVVL